MTPFPAGRPAWAFACALAALGFCLLPVEVRAGTLVLGAGLLPGRGMAGAGTAVLLDALALAQWDRGLFALGLLAVGTWLAKGAAPPADDPSPSAPGRPALRGARFHARGAGRG